MLATIAYASWPLGTTLVTALVAAMASQESTLRGAVVVGAVVAAVSGAVGALVGIVWLVPPAYAAERFVGGSLVLGGLVALTPAVTLLRARRTA